MDVTNGRIYGEPEIAKKFAQLTAKQKQAVTNRFLPMAIPPTEAQMQRKPPRVGRNEDCPCGSGKKFKHCCLRDKHDERFS